MSAEVSPPAMRRRHSNCRALSDTRFCTCQKPSDRGCAVTADLSGRLASMVSRDIQTLVLQCGVGETGRIAHLSGRAVGAPAMAQGQPP